MIRAAVISDTHLPDGDPRFRDLVATLFADCQVIIHAGDLTGPGVLDCFADKKVVAVHGNMCGQATRSRLPSQRLFELGGFSFGLVHGAGLGPDIEAALWDLFPGADCMIYGHTHRPVCHRIGETLILNPGSFRPGPPWGAPATWALLTIGDRIEAAIHEVGR